MVVAGVGEQVAVGCKSISGMFWPLAEIRSTANNAAEARTDDGHLLLLLARPNDLHSSLRPESESRVSNRQSPDLRRPTGGFVRGSPVVGSGRLVGCLRPARQLLAAATSRCGSFRPRPGLRGRIFVPTLQRPRNPPDINQLLASRRQVAPEGTCCCRRLDTAAEFKTLNSPSR